MMHFYYFILIHWKGIDFITVVYSLVSKIHLLLKTAVKKRTRFREIRGYENEGYAFGDIFLNTFVRIFIDILENVKLIARDVSYIFPTMNYMKYL